ncbi:MAG TPA: CBS domain-containing protein [Caulobacteraceae bacterium]|nr:CBS domain-containing protein [Caulobacteraceae bacterium]
MLICQVLTDKGDRVFSAAPSETIETVAMRLWTRRVGSLVILDEAGDVVGLVSERDIVRVVAEGGGDALGLPVSEVMNREVAFASPSDTVESILARMTDRRVRHLPVCKERRLVGIISIGDLVKSKIAETEAEAEHLRAYIAS